MSKVRFRTVWISDTHLGSRGCQADLLARFLKRLDCDRLYLVGDIVDFWRLGRARSFWPASHNEVVRRILKLLKRGTRVIFIPGNHDEALRHYAGTDFGGILIRRDHIHETADGRRFLVTHGDHFDLVVRHSRLLSLVGSTAYEWLLVANRHYNRFRRWRGKPYWSLAQYAKLKVKRACSFLSSYQDTLVRDARTRGLDGVVCGHIHHPVIIESDVWYVNCGDWIENCTAIVEHDTGFLELISAHEMLGSEEHLNPEEDGWEDPIHLQDLECFVDWQLMTEEAAETHLQ
jgi:UDP-2,3-diacylglucosamine pyrophosphatase LpxH